MHVLIVDDEPLAREELSYLVSQHPQVTSVAEADSVAEAMEEMMDQKPDLLFLDIHLTDESGFDLAEKLTHLKKRPTWSLQPPMINMRLSSECKRLYFETF